MAWDYVSCEGAAPIHYADMLNVLAGGGGVLVGLSVHVTANLGYEGAQTRVQGPRRSVKGLTPVSTIILGRAAGRPVSHRLPQRRAPFDKVRRIR
ncbi:hypothetical protein O0544_20470 [Edwardsiella anguillarum]|nr:hypothetical protein [Edwardsiella anguillarum]